MPRFHKKRIILILMFIFTLSGCGSSFDHSAYVKALLDACYKAEFDEYVEITRSTPERAQEQYDENMDTIVSDISRALAVTVSEENEQKIKNIMEDIFKSASYDVLGSEKVANEEYLVEVKIKPITNFLDIEEKISVFADEFIREINESDYDDMTPDDIYVIFMDGLIAILEEGTETIRYGEEKTISVPVKLEPDLKKWYVPDKDQEIIFGCIISM